jgi:ATP-dependent Clp protease adapter protein ClpS
MEMKKKSLEKYRVILKNDSHNSFEKVIVALVSIANMDVEKAINISQEVDMTGWAVITTAHFELAETIMTRLNQLDLSSYIEKDLV